MISCELTKFVLRIFRVQINQINLIKLVHWIIKLENCFSEILVKYDLSKFDFIKWRKF